MKRSCFYILSAAIILTSLASCGDKGSFPSTPDLRFKSISPNVAEAGKDTLISIICSFKDEEGDIAGPVYYRQSNFPDFDSLYSLPGLPAQPNMQGNIILQLHSNDIIFPVSSGSDTVTYFLYIKDKAGHISDTVETAKIVLLTN
jgi:hypothetical protein